MNLKLMRWAVPASGVLLVLLGWHWYGLQGLGLAVGGILMWLLLHYTRLMAVMRRASQRPVGHVASAVMLNAKLKRGATLLHVIAQTHALGERCSPADAQPELWRWSDASQAFVTCRFVDGRLVDWRLERRMAEPAVADGWNVDKN